MMLEMKKFAHLHSLPLYHATATPAHIHIMTAHECDSVDNKISCSCRKGYRVDDVDEKNCVDVDECRESNGRYGSHTRHK
jgi:hypothetical protein